MANRIKMVQKELLFILFSHHWSIRKISETNNIHRKTVRRYYQEWLASQTAKPAQINGDTSADSGQIQSNTAIQSVPAEQKQVPTEGVVHFQVPPDPIQPIDQFHSKSHVFAYHDVICQKLDAGQTARSIYQDLVMEQDYHGSYDSIKRYVKKFTKTNPKLYARIETAAGYEGQVDFGEGAPTLKNGRYHTPWLFVMTLSCSRKSYEETVWQQDVETFLICHEHAFQKFDGVPKTIKVDNLKSAVLKAHLYEPELNPNYLAFAQHYHFIPLPCKIKTPQHKGKVENNIGYIQDNALKGKKFNSLEEQNQYLRQWNKNWASTRIHGTTKRQVKLMFEEERPQLQTLPTTKFNFFKIGTRKVSIIDSYIEVRGGYYPIPPQYMGKQVIVHFNSQWVKVYYQQQLIQQLHAIPKGCHHPDKSCFPPHKYVTQNQYVQQLFQRCAAIGPAVIQWARLAEQHRQQSAYRAILGVVALTKKYPPETINQACQQSIAHHALNYHVVKNFAEQLRLNQQTQIEIQFTQQGELIRSPQEYQQLFETEVIHG